MRVKKGTKNKYICEMWNGIWDKSQKFFTYPYKDGKPYHTEIPYWPPVFFCYIERELKRIMYE